MAPSTGWRLKYSICSVSIVSVLLTFVPYTQCMRIGMPMHRFCVPHDTNPGYIVTKVLPDPRCVEMNHISQSSEKVANPFHIQDNGYLVTNSSLSDRFQDIYIIKTSPKCGNMPISPVSDSSQIHVEIVGVGGSLAFVHDKYVGTVFKDAKTGTLVEGLTDLFACERRQCDDDVRYSLQGSGSSHFYLRTVDHDGQQSVQILTNGSLQNVREETLNFIISAQNAAGLEGHTNLEINIKESGLSSEVLSTDLIQQDQNLIFQHHRQKRQTPEVRPTQTFPETKTGILFSVDTPPNPLWEYSLKSSTLENMFQVSTNGQVSLATDAQFDYEDPNKRTATLVITASQNNIDVKDIQFEISITDVNDEDPQFTNQPYPYLAVARNTDSLIYTLTAMDPDAGADLELQGDLTPDLQNLFTVTFVRPNKAEIRTTSNRLTADQEYTLRVIAEDNNAPGISTQRSIAEVLVKAGDRAPQFEKQSYTVSFQEDNNVDQVVTTEPFSATSFQGNAITLSVLDTPSSTQSSNNFGVRPDRNLFAKRKMDYETAQDREFSLTLRATESGTNYVTDVPLTVRVTDLNEEPPKFPLSSYEITFPEDVPVGTTLLQVSASDPDHNQNLTFSVDDYHFRADTVVQTADGATAVILVNQDLDFDRILLKMYDFNVTAIDDGAVPQPKSGSTVVRIVVTNVNDEYPQFPVNESAGIFMTANIRYDLEVGEIVYTLQASDADIGDKVTYQLSPANQFNNLFNLNGQEGSITLARKIADRQDQITDFKYELRVVATDDGGCCGKVNTNPTTGTVTINILTDNDMRPKFDTCQSYAPSVNENSADTFVIKVHARDDDYGSNGEVTYSIRPNQGSDNFRINATTGDVYTAKKINREALVGTTSIAINIDATDGGGSQGTCPLLVTINDVNDNEPVFTSDQYSFNVKNDLDVGSQAFQVQATDSDIGQNADVIYSFISNPDGYFKFDEQTRLTGSVRVNRTLPQEEKTITLEIQAKDNGTLVQLNSTVMVVVRFVENQNQLPPQWQGSNIDYTRRYSESVAVPTDLVPLRAVSQLDDKQLSFYIVGDASLQELFEISYGSIEGDVSTGTLKNKKSLDYETTTSYQISVRASDTGTGYADQIVTIILEDANDNSPEFLGTNSRNWLELQLNEGNYSHVPYPGELVAQLRATDLDRTSPYNQIQEFRIRNSDGTFTLDPTTGILYTRSTFDRESVPKDIPLVKSFIVEAIDAAPSSNPNANGSHNTGQATVKVTIRDVNDNAPVFDQDSYTFRVKEDKLPGTTVATLTAVDPDSDAILEYRRTPTTPFSIQQTTGAIQVQGQLDFDEGIKEYSFRVIVSDQVHEGTASVTIILEDVNDNPPQINGYTFVNFVENSTDPVGIIQRVNASDIDNGGINTFYYSLKFTDDLTSRYFAINQNTGDLSITQPLDRDYPNGKAEFTFTIEVADAPEGQNPLYGRNTVIVRPIDVNDNVPFFPADKAQMSVLENQTAVVQVGRVVVTDYDAGENAEVDLSILSQGPGDNFRLNNSFIYTTQVLDREVEDTYYIIMQAVDKGTPRLTGTGTLTITVRDINDNAPYFLKDLYEFTMSERQKDGPVGTIHANDSDTGQNAALTYSLDVNDRNYFAMSSVDNQGRLTIFAAVDYDDITARQRSFNLTAYAQDSNPGVNFENRAQTSIHVIVTDYNDEIPIFDEPQIRREEYENFTIGDAIATFRATDKDVNPQYSQFEYYIEQKSDPLRLFAIDQNGVVTLRHSLDREMTPFHTIHILAIDNPRNMPQNTGTATLLLTVLDNNDNAPDFSQAYKPSIMENQDYVATEVQKFTAKDADEDKNGPPFTFELVCAQSPSSQCSDFSLSFQQSLDNGNGEGTISVTGQFDREYEDVISLPIRMCDRHNLCAIRYMDVKINDKNDNPHDAGYQFILVNNYKGLFGDIPIGEVNVEDPDATNDDKTYELITPEAAVFVEVAPRTGIITLKPKVPEMIFSFGVRVSNQTGRVTESKVTVQVQFISEDAVYSSGSIKIDGITDKDFLLRPKKDGATSLDDNAYHESMYEKFRKLLADKLDTDIKNVFVHGVMSDPTKAEDSVTVFYSAHGSPWYQSSKMSGIVSSNKNDFQAILGNDGTIDMVPVDMCQQEDCEGGCYNDLVVTDTPRLINTHGTSFVGVNSEIKEQCGCRATTFPTNIDCTPGYCYHGGTCVKDKWNVISCECPDRFEGPRCQQLRHSFNGTGYALYKQLEQCENSRTSIEILTNKANSLILYNGPVEALGQTDQSDFILLELVNGRPRLRINHGTGELTLTIPGSKQLNDGTWHRIDIHRKKKEVRLVIDQGQDAEFDSEGNEDRSKVEATGVTPGENIYINADTLLHLGGGSWTSTLPYPSNVMSERFDGCMKNLIHNAELYDLSTGDAFPGSSDGCSREDDACGISCGNGQCLITGVQKQMCDCDPGYRTSSVQTSGSAVTCNTETTKRDFKDESYMDWALKAGFKSMLNSRRTAISFHYRSRDTDGLLFSVVDETQSSKYIKLKLLGGLLEAVYNLGDGPVRVSLSNVPADDGQWHQITVARVGKELTLKMDSGEGRYYAEFQGPENGNLDLSVRQTEIHSGANLFYSSGQPSIFVGNEEDLTSSCINDIRLDRYWFPMKDGEEEEQSFAATIGAIVNTDEGCVRQDCLGKCQQPFICIPLWETYVCDCPDYYIRNANAGCSLKDYCEDNPCVGDASCENLNPCETNSAECSSPFNKTKRYFECTCSGQWYGDLCQCHPNLGSAGDACEVPPEPPVVAAANVGLIVGILAAVVFLIVMILVIAFLIWRCYREPEEKEPFDDDPDDIRENIMYYDEEGAGEEDQTGYDLSRLRKPDDGEHVRPWDAPDIPKPRSVKPLGTTSDRPDIGDFINNRLDDADGDPNSPPYDTPVEFDYEGGNSSVGSLSSLNTSSSGDQDYDYLNEWGPKFAKLADMYNNYDETE